ncbi:MAG: EAL domain-containing protein [Betaproteobacteria bacterium]|nr:EAL domain-containing protein [Betaproteobacteria bacterium]
MTLRRQLAIAVSIVFLAALVGVQAIHLRNAQAHLQQQLDSLAQDAATSLGLSLGTLLETADAAMAETVINPAFDRGHYEHIEYVSPNGEPLVDKRLGAEEGNYPSWFVRVLPLSAPTAESLVTSGWRQLGKVRVTVHPRFAYEQLWATARDTVLYMVLIYAGAMVALHFFLRSVLRPLAAVESAAQAISARSFVTLAIRPRTRELARVVEAMNQLSRKVNEVIEAETRRAESLQAAAYQDPMTGMLNGRGFAARFESAYEGENQAFSGVLVLIEFADLGPLNKQLGAERCDELLRIVYRRIEDLARQAGGFTGRWTGSLTIVALPQMRGEAALEKLAAMRRQAGVTIKEYGVDRADRIYCGAVEARGTASTLRSLVRAAEETLVQAREAPDGVLLAKAAAEASGQADPVTTVREALAARRLLLAGQMAYRMSDHRALHTEIMARLRDAAGREMAAGEFMPIVAAHGLVQELDRGVIERVLEQARGREDNLSINVSMYSAEQPGFLDWLVGLLRPERELASRLVFEIAEHGVVKNEAAAAAFAAAVTRAGAGFAMDNFGVHRDSLALVPRLKPVYIKLAGAHTPRIVSDPGARFFAESLIRAARQLDIPVIAQMVEDDETFQSLGALGFAGYQGNLIGRPAPWPRKSG